MEDPSFLVYISDWFQYCPASTKGAAPSRAFLFEGMEETTNVANLTIERMKQANTLCGAL